MYLKKIFFIFLIFLFIDNVTSTIIVYDNLSVNNYKTLIIDDDLNYKYLTDYKYDIYINQSYLGRYEKGEIIQIPDNSSIIIYIPSPVKTDLSTSWDLGKTYFGIAILFILTFGIAIMILIYLGKKIIRR